METKFNQGPLREILAKAANTCTMSIQSYKPIGNGLYSVVATINKESDVSEVIDTFSALMEAKAAILEDTLRDASDGKQNIIKFVAATCHKSVPATDEVIAGMKAVTANVFADNNNNIWKLAGEGDAKRLVLESNDNLDDLYAQRKARLATVASASHGMSFQNNDYVAYLNPQTAQIGYGFGFNIESKMKVYDHTIGAVVGIIPELVLETISGFAEADGEDKEAVAIEPSEVNASLSIDRAEKIIAFLRKVYSSKPGLMQKYESMIRNSMGRA